MTAIVHLEGAEPIAPDLSNLEGWYERGLRSIGLTWSRPNLFAEGVPFQFPSHRPTPGGGLTAAGRELVRACNRLGILVDLSHLNWQGFWDVAACRTRRSSRPTRTRTRSARRLATSTDEQLDAIAAPAESSASTSRSRSCARTASSGGHADRPRSCGTSTTSPSGWGSTMSRSARTSTAASIPDELGGAAGLPKLVAALRASGHDDEAVAKITHRNWLRVLDATWR